MEEENNQIIKFVDIEGKEDEINVQKEQKTGFRFDLSIRILEIPEYHVDLVNNYFGSIEKTKVISKEEFDRLQTCFQQLKSTENEESNSKDQSVEPEKESTENPEPLKTPVESEKSKKPTKKAIRKTSKKATKKKD